VRYSNVKSVVDGRPFGWWVVCESDQMRSIDGPFRLKRDALRALRVLREEFPDLNLSIFLGLTPRSDEVTR